jgi:hypothetical protein
VGDYSLQVDDLRGRNRLLDLLRIFNSRMQRGNNICNENILYMSRVYSPPHGVVKYWSSIIISNIHGLVATLLYWWC